MHKGTSECPLGGRGVMKQYREYSSCRYSPRVDVSRFGSGHFGDTISYTFGCFEVPIVYIPTHFGFITLITQAENRRT